MPTPLELRWIDDGAVNFQSIIKKAVTTDNGTTWSTPATIYDDTLHPPSGFPAGNIISDLSLGVPTHSGYAIDMAGPGGGQDQWIYIRSDSSISPVIIDGTNRPSSQGGFSQYRSSWVDSNGIIWLVALSAVTHTAVTYKSTDGGATWTLMDQAHAISAGVVGNWFWDEAGHKIQFVLADGSGFMQLQEFDINTGLYTTAHDSNSSGPVGWGNPIVLVSGAIIFILYTLASGGGFTCNLSIFSGGTWSTPGPIDYSTGTAAPVATLSPTTAEIDATARAHMIFGYVGGGGAPVMFYRNSTSAASLSASHAFPSGSGHGDLTGDPNVAINIPYIDNTDDVILLNCRGFHPTSGNDVPLIFQGTPLTNPSWTGPIPVWDNATAENYGGMLAPETPSSSGIMIVVKCPCGTAILGSPFSSQFSVSGGTSPFTFVLTSGSLPPGLTLNATTGAITGTPTTPGLYSFTVMITDSLGNTDTAMCCIYVPSSGGGAVVNLAG